MPNPRPFFHKKTHELQALFEAHRADRKILLEVLVELQHRKTPSARSLREKIERELQGHSATASPGPAVPPSSTPQLPLPLQPQPTTPTAQPATDSVPSQPIPTIPIAPPVQITDREPKSTQPNPAIAPPPREASQQPPPVSRAESIPHIGLHKIQPLGVRNRPDAWAPKLKDDVQLAVTPSDPLTKVFRAALSELIRELKQKHQSTQLFVLANGRRLSADLRGYSYQFEFTEEANLFESAKVDVVIGGKKIAGQITGLFQGQLIVTLEDDFGPTILSCTLRIDNTALLQALHDRLEQIDNGAAPAFRVDFATTVLNDQGLVCPSVLPPTWPWNPVPNQQQQEFVRMALANEVTWLWGPPGTGKTDVLAVFTRLQFDAGKRVLICSNTNQAVDQLLLKLCQKMKASKESALDEGRVLRLGRIEHDELRQSFEEIITLDGIVARKSKTLTERKDVIEAELLRISEEDSRAKEVIERFDALGSKSERRANAESELQRIGNIRRGIEAELQRATSDEQRFQHEFVSLSRQAGFDDSLCET